MQLPNENVTGALALPKAERSLQVNACGRLVDISPDASTSLPLLRRELVSHLMISNPASLQLTDANGRSIMCDTDLQRAVDELEAPLQAKLTAAALHEIEQRKLEGKSKEHNLLSLQWQIVIEQVANFSYELQAMQAEMQACKDLVAKAIEDSDGKEKLRYEQFQTRIGDEAAERKSAHKDVLSRLDAMMQMMLSEQSVREVADFQLSKQIEQVASEHRSTTNSRAMEHAEHQRALSSFSQDVQLQLQKNTEMHTRHVEKHQNTESRIEEISSSHLQNHQRFVQLEADAEKIRTAMAHLDTELSMQGTRLHSQLENHGQEFQRAVQNGILSRDQEVSRISKEHETAWQNFGNRVSRHRDETLKSHSDFLERSSALEERCKALEKDQNDRQEALDFNTRGFHDKVHTAITALDSFSMEHSANEAVLKNTVSVVDDLLERVRLAEAALDKRVAIDQWKVQLDGLAHINQNQNAKIGALEREIKAGFAQESAFREHTKSQLQNSVKACIEKFSTDEYGPNIRYTDEAKEELKPKSPPVPLPPTIYPAYRAEPVASVASTPSVVPPRMIVSGAMSSSRSISPMPTVIRSSVALSPTAVSSISTTIGRTSTYK
jgi:hypothetical protein